MKQIEVVAAIIFHNDKVLCVQRGENRYDYISGKFEFPGGKIEEGETRQDTIRREILEELNIDIAVGEEFLIVTHRYPDFMLTMHSFICRTDSSELTLTEHIDYRWLERKDLAGLDWAAADIPIMEKLMYS